MALRRPRSVPAPVPKSSLPGNGGSGQRLCRDQHRFLPDRGAGAGGDLPAVTGRPVGIRRDGELSHRDEPADVSDVARGELLGGLVREFLDFFRESDLGYARQILLRLPRERLLLLGEPRGADELEIPLEGFGEGPVGENLVHVGIHLHGLELRLLHSPHRLHGRGRIRVIEKRRRSSESLVSHQLFSIQSAVGLPESDVTLARNASQCVVAWHQRLPRSACSRSIASNSALKFPAPKLFAPLRWMIS